jgi:hypothetical protein
LVPDSFSLAATIYIHLSSPQTNVGFFFTRTATEPLTLVSGSYSTAKAGKPLTTPGIAKS